MPGIELSAVAKAALALALAGGQTAKPDYAAVRAQAVRERKPLVVFVGQPARPVAGCVVVSVDALAGAASPSVVVGVPDGSGDMDRRADLIGTPTEGVILSRCAAPRPVAVPVIRQASPIWGAATCGPMGCPPGR